MDPRPAQGPQESVQRLKGSRQVRAHVRGAGGPCVCTQWAQGPDLQQGSRTCVKVTMLSTGIKIIYRLPQRFYDLSQPCAGMPGSSR